VRSMAITTGLGGQRRRRRAGTEAPVSVPAGAAEQTREDGLDVPSFLRNE
jgi:hypothetical protein